MVRCPLSTRMQRYSAAKARAARRRSEWLRSQPNRLNSPSCGVRTGGSWAFRSIFILSDRAFMPSASITIGILAAATRFSKSKVRSGGAAESGSDQTGVAGRRRPKIRSFAERLSIPLHRRAGGRHDLVALHGYDFIHAGGHSERDQAGPGGRRPLRLKPARRCSRYSLRSSEAFRSRPCVRLVFCAESSRLLLLS